MRCSASALSCGMRPRSRRLATSEVMKTVLPARLRPVTPRRIDRLERDDVAPRPVAGQAEPARPLDGGRIRPPVSRSRSEAAPRPLAVDSGRGHLEAAATDRPVAPATRNGARPPLAQAAARRARASRHAALRPQDRVRRPALLRLAAAGGASERAGGAGGGGGADRAGGAAERSGPGGPTPGCTRSGRSRTSTSRARWEPWRLAAAVNAHLRPAPVAVVAAAEVGGRLPRPLRRGGAGVSLPDRRPAGAAGARPRLRLADRACARRRRHAAGGGGAGRAARLHHLPLLDLPGEEPGPDARRARRSRRARPPPGASTASGCGRGRSCTTRCAASSGRWSGSAPAPGRRSGWARRWRRASAAPAGRCAPPDGLTLVAVRYPEDPFGPG